MFDKLKANVKNQWMGGKKEKEDDKDDSPAAALPPPFSFHNNDHYKYPSLYQEADEMLQVSLLIYTVTDLRTLAKNKRYAQKLVTPERILDLPLSLETCLEMIQDNLDLIKKQVGDDSHAMTWSALQSIQQRYEQLPRSDSGHWRLTNLGFFGSTTSSNNNDDEGVEVVSPSQQQQLAASGPMLYAFGDEKPDSDLVYAVGVDSIRKRITVAFRGSVTPMDFLTDANIVLRQQENLLKSVVLASDDDDTIMPAQGDYMGIHNGFYEYLFKARGKNEGCKYTEILEHVQALFQDDEEKQENYKLYVCGHSLGGALATLFAYKVAETALIKALNGDDDSWCIPTPVTCVSIASPRVGEHHWVQAHYMLERRGYLRHLRVANHRDPVTIMPKASGKKMWALLSPISYLAFKLQDGQFEQRETYRHAGMKLQLFKQAKTQVKDGSKDEEDEDEKIDNTAEDTTTAQTDEKLFDITYSSGPAVASTKQEEDDDDEEGIEVDGESARSSTRSGGEAAASPKKSSSIFGSFQKKSRSCLPDVAFHLGVAYTENLARVKDDLKGLTLNELYQTKAA